MTCVLAGNESLTQVNWETAQGSNHTKLGIFHPSQGIHIFTEHSGKVKIQGQQTPLASSDLSLQKGALNESELICCQFITFPSGSLKQCTNISNAVIKSIMIFTLIINSKLVYKTFFSLHIAIHNKYLQFAMCMCVCVHPQRSRCAHISS